jgi:hypothetical protein
VINLHIQKSCHEFFTHIWRAPFAGTSTEEVKQRALLHPMTDETERRLVADAQEGDDIGMSHIPPCNHFIAK